MNPPLTPAALQPQASVGHNADTAGAEIKDTSAPAILLGPVHCQGCGAAVTWETRVIVIGATRNRPNGRHHLPISAWWDGEGLHRCAA